MAIVTRAGKGAELTHTEMDNNFDELEKRPTGQIYPKNKGVGIKIDTNSPAFGWHDITGQLVIDPDDVNKANFAVYRAPIKQLQFAEGTSTAHTEFHIPHDYAPGTDLFIHVHWSTDSTLITGGSVTWRFDVCYSKGHDQAAFGLPVIIPVTQNASPTQYQHMIAETAASVSGGSGNQLDTDQIETDGIIMVNLAVDSNDITVSGGAKPNPFAHFVDIHYQSTGLPTKQKAPNFWT